MKFSRTMKSNIGIRKRIFLLLIMIFIPVLLLEVITFYSWYKDRKKAEMEANLELARASGKAFSEFVKSTLQTELVIGETATTSPIPSEEQLYRTLLAASRDNEAYRGFAWVRPDGKVIKATTPGVEKIDFSKEDYFAKVVSGKEWAISDLLVSKATGKPVFVINRGIRDKNGRLLGVVVGSVHPGKLHTVIGFERINDAGISLIDSKGMLVYRYPSAEYTWEQRHWLKLYPIIGRSFKGEDVAVKVVSQRTGRKRLAVFTPIPSIGWIASSSRAEEAVIANITKTLVPQALFMLLITLAAFGGAFWFSRPIVRAIITLRDHALQLGRGKMGRIEAGSSPGELKELADTFNEMAEKVRLREEALRESELRFRLALKNAPVLVAIQDRDLRYIWAYNQHMTFPEGIIGKLDNELFSKEEAEKMTVLKRRVLEEDIGLRDQMWFDRSNRPLFLDVYWEPVHDEEGAVIGVGSVAIDLTALKQTEEELRRSRNELEYRVQERTVQLQEAYESLQRETNERQKAEEQLRQSQKMEAIGTLAGGIAHDFNNILAAILGFTEMAIDDAADGRPVDRSLQNIHTSSLRARDLVRQILTFSRKTNYERTPLSLTPIVTETVQLLRASIPATIEIKLSITAASDTVFASPTEVQQILMNLATNASLAMEEAAGTLEIILSDIDFMPPLSEVVTDLVPGEYLQLMVKDTGKGMGPDVMGRIFEPFFTTRELGRGTGMGLAVVYGMVTDLQGAITVESEPGIGSTFRVFLPKIKTKPKENRMQRAEVPTGTESILFVDDEDMLVEWAKAALEKLGFRMTALTDPAEALKIFASDPSRFDLVITDQAMPATSGMQLAEELRAIRPDIPIILCTGHSATVSPEKAQQAGIKKFLMKPVAIEELAKAVRSALDACIEDRKVHQ